MSSRFTKKTRVERVKIKKAYLRFCRVTTYFLPRSALPKLKFGRIVGKVINYMRWAVLHYWPALLDEAHRLAPLREAVSYARLRRS